MRLVFIGLVGLTACGGGNFNSSVPRSAALSELDAEQICTLQEELVEWTENGFASEFCYLIGQGSGIAAEVQGLDFRDACDTAYDECVADFGGDLPVECDPDVFGSNCTATVLDLEDCYNDTLEVFSDLASSRCNPITLEEFTTQSLDLEETPQSCMTLRASCPAAF